MPLWIVQCLIYLQQKLPVPADSEAAAAAASALHSAATCWQGAVERSLLCTEGLLALKAFLSLICLSASKADECLCPLTIIVAVGSSHCLNCVSW